MHKYYDDYFSTCVIYDPLCVTCAFWILPQSSTCVEDAKFKTEIVFRAFIEQVVCEIIAFDGYHKVQCHGRLSHRHSSQNTEFSVSYKIFFWFFYELLTSHLSSHTAEAYLCSEQGPQLESSTSPVDPQSKLKPLHYKYDSNFRLAEARTIDGSAQD